MLSQASKLEVHAVPDGYIVYEPGRDRVHYLNKTAAIIFELCDGKHGEDYIVAQVAKAYGLEPSPHEEVRSGIKALLNEGLVTSSK